MSDTRTPSVLAYLEKLGLRSCHLDSAVHDAASEMASAVNNEGMKEQVEFLLKTNTWKPEDILFAAKQEKEGGESVKDVPDDPMPKFMLSREGDFKGEIIGTRRCQLGGCGAEAYIVRWPNKRRTYICSEGCKATDQPETIQIA